MTRFPINFKSMSFEEKFHLITQRTYFFPFKSCSFEKRSHNGASAACFVVTSSVQLSYSYCILFYFISFSQKEEERYRYDKPGKTSKTSRFTNNVWKLTTDVGFGMGKAKYKGVLTFFVVAYFFPKGNEPTDFARNVLRKGSVSSVTSRYYIYFLLRTKVPRYLYHVPCRIIVLKNV